MQVHEWRSTQTGKNWISEHNLVVKRHMNQTPGALRVRLTVCAWEPALVWCKLRAIALAERRVIE